MLYVTLRQYAYVVAVAEAGSLTGAAAQLAVSQPSLSVAITRVEQRVGQRIFVRRKGTPVILTPYGHQFVRLARRLLHDAAALELGNANDVPFVLACFEDIAPWYLAPALAALQSNLPGTTFDIREGRFEALVNDLSEGRADIAMTFDLGLEAGFERTLLKKTSPVAFMRPDHPLAGKPAILLDELETFPLILYSEDRSMRHMLSLFRRLGLSMHVAHQTASLEMMRSLCAHGVGIGISYSVPPLAVSYDNMPLVTVPIKNSEAVAEIVLTWSNLNVPHRDIDKIRETLVSLWL